jgi:stage III sporulation protein AH
MRRKFVWLMILMVWVGMVTSIVIYQEDNIMVSKQAATENIEIIENTSPSKVDNITNQINTTQYDDINYTKSEDNQQAENFFIEYRLERDKARSEQLDIYREMINNSNTDKITKEEAQNKMLQLTEKMEKEMEIESLIRARGYSDALAYVHDQAVDVIVQTGGLNDNDVAKIGDIIVKTTGFDFEDVTIIEKKAS